MDVPFIIIMQDFFVYILRCNDDSFYVGHTDNMEARLSAHEQRHYARCYTVSRLPVKVVFVQGFGSRIEALEAERQIKKWPRAKKQALIDGDFERLKQLAKTTYYK
jgi:predicted GIY-YIG superfamily endonuclease